jgi:hypothetical protein
MEKTPPPYFPESCPQPGPHADRPARSPPTERGWIRQSVWILDVGSRLLPTAVLLLDFLCGLLPAMKAVVAAGRRPDWQDGEGLVAWWATAAADTDEIVNLIVRLLAALAVADDRSISAQGAPAGQKG